MQEVASTTVSTYSAPIAPCACRAILPVSNDKVRPPTSKLTFSNIKHVLFSPLHRSLVQIRETTLGKYIEEGQLRRKERYTTVQTFSRRTLAPARRSPGNLSFVRMNNAARMAAQESALLTQAESFHNLAIPIRVAPIQVVQQPSAFVDHHDQPPPRGVILRVGL